MRIIDKNGNTITDYDLSKGYLLDAVAIKEDATPLGDDKQAWYDNDYEDVKQYCTYNEDDFAQKAETEAARAVETQRVTAMSLFIQTADLTDEQALTVSMLYPEWKTGVEYEARQIVQDGGHLFRCAQKHTSSKQSNTSVASLWTQINKAGDGVDVWKQPSGAHDAYNTGDRVHYPDADGPIYVSKIDGNAWSPDAYPAGWEEAKE